jgi:hypothetical protein
MDGAEEAELPSTDVISPEKEENLHSSFNPTGHFSASDRNFLTMRLWLLA